MADCMIDIEGLATGPDATILTIAAQIFDPLDQGWLDRQYYCRVDFESQSNREVQQTTIDWWSQQPEPSRREAFSELDRVPLGQALQGLHQLVWQCKRVWMNGPTYDATILEHAYKSLQRPLPWTYTQVRDCRTVYSLWPDVPKPPITHHALEDCRRQITMLQQTLRHLNIREIR
jgi:hypothetical protein